MIKVTAINGNEFYLNPDHIEKIEEVPETVLSLSNGKKYIVKESIEDVIESIVKFKRRIYLKGI